MVTGFEATGLALAIFPIVLQGIAKAKGLKDQDGASKRLVRELKMEKCKFVNTSHTLLGGMSVSEEQIQVLVSGKGWEDSDFQVQLEQHLGQELANAFTESVEALHSSLKDLSKDIGLDRHRKVSVTGDTREYHLLVYYRILANVYSGSPDGKSLKPSFS
jgi:hypothetical protein